MAHQKPTRERPLLVGVLADVSGSMLESMGDSGSRLETFRDSLHDLADRARDLSTEDESQRVAPLVKLFAYGFGFGNFLSFFTGDSGPEVRDLLELEGQEASTVPLDELARDWERYERHLQRLSRSMAGGTPMLPGFRAAQDRFRVERSTSPYTANPVLFVLSDGMPTEGTGTEQDIVRVALEMQASGITIVSCYVTDADIAEPRRLYGRPGHGWPDGARLMFQCSSPLEASSEFERYLAEYDWTLEDDCKLFTQINQSEILSEFLNLVLSPLDEPAEGTDAASRRGAIGRTKGGRVFISYSHKDKKWLERLRVYLRPLERAGLVDIWDDTRILAGTEWAKEISQALDRATVAVLLVTADFLASDFVVTKELPRLLEAAQRRGLVVLPVIVSASDFGETPSLSRYQAVNSLDRPLNGLRVAERDRVLVDLGRRIRSLSEG